VEQELSTLPEHLSSPPVLVGFVLLDFYFYVYVLYIVVCPFVLFLFTIVLSVLLRFTDSGTSSIYSGAWNKRIKLVFLFLEKPLHEDYFI
jgi:hypothetical protein